MSTLARNVPQQCVRKPKSAVKSVIGPDGSLISKAHLPPVGTIRWVAQRKALVVAAVRGGLLSLEEACKRYSLTVEEFFSWQRSIDEHGLAGLRATRVQQYRSQGETLPAQLARTR